MTTSFSSLPIIDLAVLSNPNSSTSDLQELSSQLFEVFATTGFAYLVNAPLSFSHNDVFTLASDFFNMDQRQKMSLAKKTFVPWNRNTYRGYFPPQPESLDNLKEGFEIGPPDSSSSTKRSSNHQKFDLTESNVWPSETSFPNGRQRLESLHKELQDLSSKLLSLLAVSLSKPADFFSSYLVDSLSTLRLLHYPPHQPASLQPSHPDDEANVKLCCTPHTDSGILTLLHQDPTGGLEVLNAAGEWIPAPYVPGSIVVNIGDLLAEVSGGRFVATMHRVRANSGGAGRSDGLGRFSVPFFFEPGELCVVRSVDDDGSKPGVVYGAHVRRKMSTWVEFQDPSEIKAMDDGVATSVAVEA